MRVTVTEALGHIDHLAADQRASIRKSTEDHMARRIGQAMLDQGFVLIEVEEDRNYRQVRITMSVEVEKPVDRPPLTADRPSGTRAAAKAAPDDPVTPPEFEPSWLVWVAPPNCAAAPPKPEPKPLDLDFTKSTAIVPHEGKK